MARRIDVELTSARDDDTWTWRAAGAKQPKGVLEGKLLYEGAAVGDVVRAEAEFEIDGIFVTAVFPPKEKKRVEPQRLEVIGTPREHQGVTSSLVGKRDRPDRGDRDRKPRPDRTGRSDRTDRPERKERAARPPREARASRPPREARPAPPPKPKRLSPLNVHRAAVLEDLSPELRPVAEQVLRGGIPAVRQAVEAQNAKMREAGEPEVKAEPLVAMAEELLPRLKAADWRDRAEAAVKDVDEIALRDLRSVVAGADAVARDDETRLLAGTLREALQRRVAQQREEWVKEIETCLTDGRLVRALRVSARPPDPGTRFPAELSTRLAEAAGAALNPDVLPDRWATVLDAVASSPVRRQVTPVGLPAEPGEQLLQAAKQASGLVPALAKMLGIDMPPPPPSAAARRKRPVPPPPARPPAVAQPPAPAPEAGGQADTPQPSTTNSEPSTGTLTTSDNPSASRPAD